MKCFYHSADLDGHCSGAIVKHKHPECEMIGINYGDAFPWDSIKPDDIIYMVDFCLQPFSDMIKLAGLCNELILIDHHKTTIDEVEKLGPEELKHPNFTVSLYDKKAGCELTWEYFYGVCQGLSNEPEMNTAVYFLGRYDVWDQSNKNVLPFQYGMRQYNTDPSTETGMNLWRKLFKNEDGWIISTVQEGNAILRFVDAENAKYAAQTAFDIQIQVHYENNDSAIKSIKFAPEGSKSVGGINRYVYKAIAINRALGNSMIFDSIYDPEKHDLMVPFYLTKNGVWTVSLYTTHDHIDCSEIAKKMGGGGHKKAAGFQVDNLDKIGL